MVDHQDSVTVEQSSLDGKEAVADSLPSLPVARKLTWGVGAFTDVIMNNAYGYVAIPIYHVALHLPLKMLTLVPMITCLMEMVVNTSIANISDNTRSRWGRRIPFIFAGSLLCGLLFSMTWAPPRSLSPLGLGLYFAAFYIPYCIAYALFTVPWGALGLELSPNIHERSSVQTYKTICQTVGGLALGVLWWLAFKLGNGDEVAGMRWVGLIVGSFVALSGITAALGSRESAPTQARQKINFRQAILSTFQDRHYLMVVGLSLLVLVGLFLIQPMALFINIHYVYGGNKENVATLNMMLNFIFQGVGLALAPLIAMVSRRIGKKVTLCSGLAMVMVGYLLSWWTYTPQMPYLQTVTLGLCAAGMSCLWIIAPSMIADLCELDELRSGSRKEGMYYAIFAWATKVGVVGSLWLSAFLVAGAGYLDQAELQSAAVVRNLRLLYMIVPTIFAAMALTLALAYPITEARLLQIRKTMAPPTQS